jgi:phosphosulfolactate phosphohydrolase-like enzyme
MKATAQEASDAQPKAVVVAAYAAANRGQYAAANALLAPELKRSLVQSTAGILSEKALRRRLLRLKGRRDAAGVRARTTLRKLIRSNRLLARAAKQLGSPQFLRDLWRCATRQRSLVEIKAIRQVVRGSQARVYLRLKLRDGSVVRDSEPLVLAQGRWRLG